MNTGEDKLRKLSDDNLEKAGLLKKEEPKEVTKEEPKKEEPLKKETSKEEPKKQTLFEKLEKHNIKVKDEDELENLILTHTNKLNEYTTKESEYQKQLEELKGYKDAYENGFDPMQYFSDTNSFKREQLKKIYPDLSIDIADQVISSDLTKISPKELIAMELKMTDGSLSQHDIDEYINEKYGTDEERTAIQKIQLKNDTKEILKKVEELKSKVKEPEKIDLKALQEKRAKESSELETKLNTDWSREINSVLFDKFTITDKVEGKDVVLFSQEVEADFKDEAKQEVIEFFVKNKIPYTQDAVKFAVDELNEKYRRENMPKIMKLFAQQEADKREEEVRKEYAGMGHVSRKSDGTKLPGHLTTVDKENMVHGTTRRQ